MKWLYKLEYKLGRYAIHNLMLYIITGQFIVFVADMMFNSAASFLLSLDIGMAIEQLQLWRFITFIFVPGSMSTIFFIFTLYFYYFVSRSLENQWGSFLFNAFYLFGALGTIIGALIMALFNGGAGYGTINYLNLSLLFAFAILFPDVEFMLFFLLPIKAKWFALFSAVLTILSILQGLLLGRWGYVISAIVAFANLIIFFWNDLRRIFKKRRSYRKTRDNFNNQMREWKRNQQNYNDR